MQSSFKKGKLMKKIVSLAASTALLLASTASLSQAKTQTITVSNVTDRDMAITIQRPDQKPCRDIQDIIKATLPNGEIQTKNYTLSSTCPLTQLKVLDSSTGQEKNIDQLTYGTYTRFLIEPNQAGDDIIVSPFLTEQQTWDARVAQAKDKLTKLSNQQGK
jgi:hypothetical protein